MSLNLSNTTGTQLNASPIAENYGKVQQAVEYGNGMEQAARKFQAIIIGLWALNTFLIFTHRLLHREKPIGIQLTNPINGEVEFSWELDYKLSDRQQIIVEHLDNILFTVNYALLSFLMVLQFMPYGKVTKSTGVVGG